MLDHLRAERHGETLGHVDDRLGALAGVDAAVPDFLLAGQIGRREQFTLAQTTGAVQIGGVVPLAHAFAAQTQQDCIQAAIEARIGACAGDLFHRQRRGSRWRGNLGAQLLLRQLFVETAGAGDRLELALGVGTILVARTVRQIGPATPVDPGRVRAARGAHGLDAAAHHFPLPATQRRAGAPGQHVVIQVGVAGHVAKIGECIGRQRNRRLLADEAPNPVALFGRELHAPLGVEQTRRGFGVAHRHADQRQHDEFLLRLAGRGGPPRQVFGGGIHGIAQIAHRIGSDDFHRLAHRAQAVRLGRQARLAPDIGGLDFLVGVQLGDGIRAAVIEIALRVPIAQHQIRALFGSLTDHLVDIQRIALHFLVVTHAEFRMHVHEALPIAPLAQKQQPIVTQSVFLVAAGVALQKRIDLGLRRVFEARLQLPVGRPRLQHVATRAGQQRCELLFVFLPERFLHFQQHIVASGLSRNRGNRTCQTSPKQ